MVGATFEGLEGQGSARTIAAKRGLKVQEVVGRRAEGVSEAGMDDSAN